MKKIIIGLFVAAIFFLIIFLVFKKSQLPTSFSRYIIDGQMYHLLTARNPIQWTKGLMYYKDKNELNGADGMIFIFPTKTVQSFWNKNTYVDLDIYWMDGDNIVEKSYLPSILKSKEIVVVNSGQKVDRVVEVIR